MWSLRRIFPAVLLCVLIQLLLGALQVDGSSQKRGPVSYISLVENPRIHTPSQRVHAHSKFDITFTLHGGRQEVRLSLEPNLAILSPNAVMEYHDETGKIVRKVPMKRDQVKVFKGLAWVRDESGEGWTNAGWARIMVQQDGEAPLFTGSFGLYHDSHHIQLRSWYLKTKDERDPAVEESGDEYMIVFRDSDVQKARVQQHVLGARSVDRPPHKGHCMASNLTFNNAPENPIHGFFENQNNLEEKDPFGLKKLFTRSIDNSGQGNSGGIKLKDHIGQTNGCPTTNVIALVGVAADCTYTALLGNEEKTREHIIAQFNSASGVFESTFNISLGIQTLAVMASNCPGSATDTNPWNIGCSTGATLANRLSTFSEWRGKRSDDKNAFWTLLTTCETDSAVGLSWVGMLCVATSGQSSDGQFISGANVVAKTPTEWKVIAHEIGHTMGAVHDCTSDLCAQGLDNTSECCPLSSTTCDANGQYMMNPSTDDHIEHFSPCTVGNICGAFSTRSVNKSCLADPRDVTLITSNECGNGIVESGEECDCGGDKGCVGNTCCDPKTCKFINNAVCDDSNDDCCHSCQFSPSTTVCRPSTGECDYEERCTGNSGTCPKDALKNNGESCSIGKCASGQCTSRDQQCRVIMGLGTGTNDTNTKSCNENSCRIECTNPNMGVGFCYLYNQNFLDGTPCNGDGMCWNGICNGASTLGTIKSWITRNKNIVIGIAVAVGVLLLISFVSLVMSCCRRRRASTTRRKMTAVAAVMPGQAVRRLSRRYAHVPQHQAPESGGGQPPQYYHGQHQPGQQQSNPPLYG